MSLQGLGRRFIAWALPVILLFACCGKPRTPVIVFGVDGLEWSVILPMLRQGKLPVMEGLMKRGVFGRLETIMPPESPVIWTSIATGKEPDEHGIEGFAYRDESQEPHLLASTDRKTKAFWNILTDYGLIVHSIGWWMTFPVEDINGVMVAQANTIDQLDVSKGRAVWKGTVLKGMPGQVHPTSMQNEVMSIVEDTHRALPAFMESVFGRFPHPLSELDRRLWENTKWVLRADAAYLRIAKDILESRPDYDLLAIYFGGTDVVEHRFWRYTYPDEYLHRPTPEQLENLGHVIEDYYSFIDTAIGQILATQPGDATVFVISDHGMEACNQEALFDPDEPPEDVNSAHHWRGLPGVLIAAGRYIRAASSMDVSDALTGKELPAIGSVLDITPTLLALKEIPVGADMQGMVLERLLAADFLENHPVTVVASHDTSEWVQGREAKKLEHRRDEEERLEQLRALGYIE